MASWKGMCGISEMVLLCCEKRFEAIRVVWWLTRIKNLSRQHNLGVVLSQISVHKSWFDCSITIMNEPDSVVGNLGGGKSQRQGQQQLGIMCCSIRPLYLHKFYLPSMPVSNSSSHISQVLYLSWVVLSFLPAKHPELETTPLYLIYCPGNRRDQVLLYCSLHLPKTHLNLK